MLSALRSLFLGTKRSEYGRYLVVGVAFGAFVITFVAYGLGIFSVSMGLVWIPFHAAIVGMIAGCWVGYSRGGVVLAWIVTYTSLLGYLANRAVLGQSSRKLVDQVTYFLRLDGLVYLAVEGIILGTIAFTLGRLARWGIDTFRRNETHYISDKSD